MQSSLVNARRRIKTASSFNKTGFFLYHLRHSSNRGALLFVGFEISPSQWQLPVGTITDCFSKLSRHENYLSSRKTLRSCFQRARTTKAMLSVILDYSINFHNCVNNKMLEYDWLLTAVIFGLIGCFWSKLSDLTCAITNICNRTSQIGQLSSK